MIKVSIIMGIYNCENTIKDTIDSILNQTFKDWELIMCDDCSTDKTLFIAEEYSIKFPEKIKILKNEKNLTLGPTLNRCLDIAQGKFIARMDSDDICLPDRLSKQFEFLSKHEKIHLVGSNAYVFDGNEINGELKKVKNPTLKNLLYRVPFIHPTIMIRKEILKKLKGYSTEEYAYQLEDYELWFRFYKNGFSAENIQEPLIKYREDLSAFKRRNKNRMIRQLKLKILMFKELNISKKYYFYLLKEILIICLPRRIMSIYYKNRY